MSEGEGEGEGQLDRRAYPSLEYVPYLRTAHKPHIPRAHRPVMSSQSYGEDGEEGGQSGPSEAQMMCVFDAITGGTGGDTPMTEEHFEAFDASPSTYEDSCIGITYAPTVASTLAHTVAGETLLSASLT